MFQLKYIDIKIPYILNIKNYKILESKNFSSFDFKLKFKYIFKKIFFKVLISNNILKFIYIFYFVKKHYLNTFVKYLNKFFYIFSNIYRIRIKIKTYFFRIFSSLEALFLDMRSSHLYILEYPINFYTFTRKRSIILFSLNKYNFKNAINKLINFKRFNIYTGKGLHLAKSRFKKKKGKIR